ncbi:hypothetical protein [Sphingosinithalassobacter portus]|uniref:hypothetical protein n=1 Tax=Stakelama portus TaxID=2676234 RepID=UPI001EFE9D81|nr:hypothetical protein [Sphingosinithalassobacter portus]
MSTRTSDPARLLCVALLLLAGCDSQLRDKTDEVSEQANREAMAKAEGKILCAPDGATGFSRVCTIDRTPTQDGLYLTIRQPSGGFRRLLVTNDGRGVIAADGAEQSVVTPISDSEIEVAVGKDRYRLPATVKPMAAQ